MNINLNKFERLIIVISKIVLVGEAAVGKSTIRERYLGIDFREAYLQTVGADYTIKEQPLTDKSVNDSIGLQIWDLAGQQGFSNIRESFYKGTDGIVLIFDVTNPKTADRLRSWIVEVKKNIRKHTIPIVIVGNKIDLRHDNNHNNNVITHEKGLKIAESLSREFNNHITYIESSAKTGTGIDNIFRTIANLVAQYKSNEKEGFVEISFQKYFDEVSKHIQLFFFKLMDDGPACVAQTNMTDDPELLFKMAIYYSTVVGQGANEHTGLYGPFPIPKTTDENFMSGQSLIYSFKMADEHYSDIRAKGVNFCFIVITIAKDLVYQFSENSTNRFFYNQLEKINDTQEIDSNFLQQMKTSLLNNIFILNK